MHSESASLSPDTAFLRGGGETGALIAARDWSGSPLGPPASWPATLKTTVGILLRTPVPMVLLWGPDGVMLYNDAYSVVAGARHPRLLGCNVREGWPEIAEFNDHVMQVGLAGGTLAFRDQELTLHRHGAPEQVWFNLDYSPVPDENGDPAGVMAIVVETTSRVLAERAKVADGERLRQMFDQAPGFMAMLHGPDHVFELANAAYLQLIGHRDVIGMPVRQALPEIEGQGFFKLLDNVFASGTSFTGQALPVALQRRPGAAAEQRFVDLVYQPVSDTGGEVTGIFVEGYDVTEAHLAQEAVRRSEERVRRVVEGVKDHAVFTTDINGLVTDWTPGAELVFGWSAAEVEGKNCDLLFTQQDRADGVPAKELATARQEGCAADERWHVRKDGSRFFANGSVRPLHDGGGEIRGFIKIARDETQRRSVEKALRASEEFNRRILQSSADCIKVLDLDGHLEFMSEGGMCAMEVDDFHAIEGACWPDMWQGEEHIKAAAAVAEAKSGRTGRFQGFNPTMKGTPRWWDVIVTPVAGPDGLPEKLLSISRDVTETKQVEVRLTESEGRFQAVANSIDQMVWSARPDGDHDFFNQRWYEYTGVPEGSTDGEAWNGVFHPDDRDRAWASWRRSLDGGTPYEIEYRLRHRSGAYRWVLGRAQPVRDAAGRITRWFGTCTDIQEIVEAREVLARSREELEFEVAARTAERDRIWELSRDLMAVAGFDGLFKATNPAFERMLGHPADSLIGTPFADLIHPDDLEAAGEVVAKLAQGQPTISFEDRLRHADGSWRWISWTGVPEGELFYAVGRDISVDKEREAELQQAQEALRQAQKMEAMGQLTGGVAHDFNNLLTPIIGALDMLQRRAIGGEREQRLIGGALQSADRAKTLVQRLLAFARRQPLKAGVIDMGKLLDDMAELVASTSGPQVKVTVHVPERLRPATADQNQLEMAILNLAVNARDAMPDGGTLTLAAADDDVGPEHRSKLPPGAYVRLCVADTGEGMDAATLKRAVEPFFSTKGVGKGTGLGLSMVHGLASQLGGALAIASEPGLGTKIELWLPASRLAAPADAQHADPEPAPPRAGCVLLVDDEAVVRTSTADMLTDLGYDVVEAASAGEALKLLDGGLHADLLLTDHLMPGMTGTDLAREVRGRWPDRPVLLISGFAEAEGVAPDLPRLTKPFRQSELSAMLATLS